MAFILQNLTKSSYGNNTDFTINWAVTPGTLLAKEGGPSSYLYQSATDTQAVIAAANYFNIDSVSGVDATTTFCAGDTITAIDSTGVRQEYTIASVTYGPTGVVTLAAPGGTQNVVVTLTAAQFLGMEAAPVQVIPAQGANKLIRVHDFSVEVVFGAVQLANGGAVGLEYGNTAVLAGPLASATIAAAGFTGAAASSVMGALGALPVATTANTVNTGVFISNLTAPYINGDSTFRVYVNYSVLTTA